jgi:undecaprenyl diphosphate synthase
MAKNEHIPKHIAIIMDGNGRWAARRGLPRIMGHRAGVKSAQEAMEAAGDLGVKVLTLYTFSTENWKRPKAEVGALFGLLQEYIDREGDKIKKNNIRFSVIGRMEELPPAVKDRLQKLISETRGNTGLIVNLALNYGGRPEIIDAVRAISADVKTGKLGPEDVDEKLFSKYLYTKDLPDPDLLIRTSGEYRISNFLLWQISYSEIYVTKKLWPDFRREDLRKAIDEYRDRDRRFGG